jgi:signal-transduction protein with cAMP-binding, CBS, and nucleotidyltransferase domain
MPLNPNIAVLLRRIETMPLATYQPGETVIAAGTKTGRLLILKKGAVTIRKNGSVIAEVTEPGAVFGELSALLNQPHTADVRTSEPRSFASRRPTCSWKIPSYSCTLRQSWHSVSTSQMKLSLTLSRRLIRFRANT